MKFKVLIFSLIIGSWFFNARALEMTLEQCVDSALVSNRGIKARSLDVEKSRILKGTAFNPESTSILLKQETTGGGGPENGVMFSQDFDFPSVYVARSRNLKAEENLQKSRYLLAVNDLVAEISSEYQNALYLKSLISINDSLEYHYLGFLNIAKARFDAGECSSLEVINAERAFEKVRMEKRTLLAVMDVSLSRLRQLCGCSQPVEIPSGTVLEKMSIDSFNQDFFNFNSTLRGTASECAVKIAETEINLEKQKFFPSINLGVTVQALIRSFNPYHIDREPFPKGNFMGFEAGISLPVFFWSQGARLKSAKTALAAARLEQEYAASEAETEYMGLLRQLETSESILQDYNSNSLSRAAEILRITKISYELGEIDYLEYMSNVENAYSIRKDYAAALNDYNMTVIKLNRITGK